MLIALSAIIHDDVSNPITLSHSLRNLFFKLVWKISFLRFNTDSASFFNFNWNNASSSGNKIVSNCASLTKFAYALSEHDKDHDLQMFCFRWFEKSKNSSGIRSVISGKCSAVILTASKMLALPTRN